MPSPLDDCEAKINRAREHLATLTGTVEAFLARDPYQLVQYDDAATNEHVVSVHVTEECPSSEIATLVGDAAHNLRSALDYLSNQLVLANGEVPTTATEFLIFLDAAHYAAGESRRTRGMSTVAAALLRRLQPFASANPDHHLLWVLHELNNADKHRQLSVVGSAVIGQALTVTGNMQVRVHPAIPVSLGAPMQVLPVREGMELIRLAIVDAAAGGVVQAEGSFAFGVSFQSPTLVQGKAVVQLMRSVTDGVAQITGSAEVRALLALA